MSLYLLELSCIGLASGLISGLLGVGGGVVLVPAILFFLPVDAHKAIGISLAVIVPTALSAAYRHFQYGNVDIGIAAIIAVGASVGAYGGATLANQLDPSMLRKLFGVFLVFMGVNLLSGWTDGVKKKATARLSQQTDLSQHDQIELD